MWILARFALDRLNAEIGNVELRTYLDAFDVDNYTLPMLNLLEGATPAKGGNERRRLLEVLLHRRELGKSSRLVVTSVHVVVALKAAISQRRRTPPTQDSSPLPT